jgi:hypothetical protein
VILAISGWALARVLTREPGYLTLLVIAFLAVWMGLELVQCLLEPFVLTALPATITRVATVLCLGCGTALALIAFRLAGEPLIAGARRGGRTDEQDERDRFEEAYTGW